MQFNSIPEFLNILEKQIDKVEEGQFIESATIIPEDFSDEEKEKFDSIVDEAEALCGDEGEVIEYIYRRLSHLGYNDDQITQILDSKGY